MNKIEKRQNKYAIATIIIMIGATLLMAYGISIILNGMAEFGRLLPEVEEIIK